MTITREEIEELFARYAWAYDVNDVELLAQCFARDADYAVEITGGESLQPITGGEQIVAFIAATRASQSDQRRHVLTNFRVLSQGDARTTVRAYLLLIASSGTESAVAGAGVYEVDAVREDGSLRFARFHLTLDSPF